MFRVPPIIDNCMCFHLSRNIIFETIVYQMKATSVFDSIVVGYNTPVMRFVCREYGYFTVSTSGQRFHHFLNLNTLMVHQLVSERGIFVLL